MGNPTASATTTKRTAEFGISKNGKTCVVSCVRNHATTPVSDCCAVNVAPFQLGQKVRWIHSVRVDEALVTAALYLDARDLKRMRNRSTRLKPSPVVNLGNFVPPFP